MRSAKNPSNADTAAVHSGRRPAHLEMTGGKSPRQRLWEAILDKKGEHFTLIDVLPNGMNKASAVTYLTCLKNGGYIERAGQKDSPLGGPKRSAWQLVKDNGLEAPRLNSHGEPVTAGLGNEAMWQQMRHFLHTFDARELAAHASSAAHPVAESTAKSYIGSLAAAGYLIQIEKPGNAGKGRLARWMLDPIHNTGPRPPMVQRTKTLYDANLGCIVWHDDPDWGTS